MGGGAVLTVYPSFYPRFRCAAGNCRHTCCAGWEIDIDEETAARYAALSGALGDKLRRFVERDPSPHFILGPGERCPFLTDGDLCELILRGGEDLLCQICRDHPRHRSFLPGRTEVGLGLCCEAAGRLILTDREPVRLLTEGTEDPEDEAAAALIRLRDRALVLASDRRLPLQERMDRVTALCGGGLPGGMVRRWADFSLGLERLDEGWTDILLSLRDRGDAADRAGFRRYMTGREHEYEKLFWYFLYRHLLSAYEDGDPAGKAAFAALGTRLLFVLGALHWEEHGSFTEEDQIEYARMFSSEIEYSEENLDAFFDELWGGPWNG